jgi:hypothetical protein
MSICNNITINELNNITGLFMKQYDMGVEAELNDEEKDFLDKVVYELDSMFSNSHIQFNSDKFKTFIKKIYPKNAAQFGGDDETAQLQRPQRTKFGFMDFLAIVIFVGSIFVCYLAYIRFNELTMSVSGLSIGDMSSQIGEDIKIAIDSVKNLPKNDLTFIQAIYRSFSSFFCSITDSQIQNISKFTQELLLNSIEDAKQKITDQALTNCGLNSKIVTSTDWMFGIDKAIGIDKFVDTNKVINSFGNALAAATAPGATSSCVSSESMSAMQLLMLRKFSEMNSMVRSVETKGRQIASMLQLGSTLGAGSALYISNRLRQAIMPRRLENERVPNQITNTGGKKSKKNKKSKSKKSKSKKSKSKMSKSKKSKTCKTKKYK